MCCKSDNQGNALIHRSIKINHYIEITNYYNFLGACQLNLEKVAGDVFGPRDPVEDKARLINKPVHFPDLVLPNSLFTTLRFIHPPLVSLFDSYTVPPFVHKPR
jgi:hypothetical protein